MLMDNKKSNLSISSNKDSMAEKKITGKEKEDKENIKESENIKEKKNTNKFENMNNKKNTNEFKNIKNSEKVKKYKNINEIGDIKKKKNNKDINEFESIKEFYKKYVVIGFFVVGILGTLFHFVYDWSGQMWFVGLFVPVNESTWEHMKLLFVPMLIYIMLGNLYIKRQEFMQSKKYKEKNRSNNIKINRDIYGYNAEIVNDRQDKNNELHQIGYTGLFGNIFGTWSIPFLFYGYKGILGFEIAWVDISTFFVAVLIAFAVQYHVLIYSYKKQTQNCGKTVLIVNLAQLFVFVLLTYHPLNLGIFISPV